MILTVTANPSLDRTVGLEAPLARGKVQRAVSAGAQPGGKGVNVSRALHVSGTETLAILPGDPEDPVVHGLALTGVPTAALPVGAPIRSNITVTEPDGTTTKINEPGSGLTAAQVDALVALVLRHALGAEWVVLAGSLPPGAPVDLWARMTEEIRTLDPAPAIAVDASGAPLQAAMRARPDLIKPNEEELAELLAGLGEELEAPITDEPESVVPAAALLVTGAAAGGPGAHAVLATLGGNGAVLVTADLALHAVHAPVTVRSTVGAGDSSLAGYLLAAGRGDDEAGRLRQAVAHGSAAASLPGTTVPGLTDTTPDLVHLHPLPLPSKEM